jgi:hypothetical protein
MDETTGLSDQYRRASPWPPFVALGVPVSELGIVFDLFPIAVGGLVLFCGSVAGMAREAGYARTPWRALAALAVLLVAVGGALVVGTGLATRGYAVVTAGVLLGAGAVAGALFVDERAR